MLAASEAGGRGGDAATARATTATRKGGIARRSNISTPPAKRALGEAEPAKPGRGAGTALPMGFEAFFKDGLAGEREAGRWFETEKATGATRVHIFAAPVVPGKEEVWRRFLQEVAESRAEYERLCRRLGVRREKVWVVPSARSYTTVVYLEIDGDLDGVIRGLADTEEAFDLWFKRGIAECHDRIGPAESWAGSTLDPVFSWT